VPALEGPVSWPEALARAAECEVALIADAEGGATLRSALGRRTVRSGILYTGPEGGFTPQEIAAGEHAGVIRVSLGKRTLRAETAAIAGIAILLDALEGESRTR
jgi:16S rRNA (uracil1498-N3)-methyltransferase